MEVYLNGNIKESNQEILHDFLAEQDILDRSGIAVALNEEVIPRSNWQSQKIKNSDKILIITATQGG